MTDLLHLDAFSGVSGDMLVAALLDLGVGPEIVDDALAPLGLSFSLTHSHVERHGIRARRFVVECPEEDHERHLSDILALLAPLPAPIRERAHEAFARLAEAEAAVHGTTVDAVHFHEVGAVDSIVDVVAACAALAHLDATLSCTPLPLGHGLTKSRHGTLPLPAPATLLCLKGVPTYDAGIAKELVTPTGACLVAGARFTRWPSMRPKAVGFGAGTRDLADRPNVLRAVLGEPLEDETAALISLETNLDDATPELIAHALDVVREAGARDAWITPVQMKKGRSGTQLTVLADAPDADRLARVILRETPTLGVRFVPFTRLERPRRTVVVPTPFGPVPLKVADGDGLPTRAKPEHDACVKLARQHQRPLDEIVAAALQSFRERAG
ncbi:MAG: nickel pincer cofactor biosynthesis protein LarC [Sandaracinaceae bacterium]